VLGVAQLHKLEDQVEEHHLDLVTAELLEFLVKEILEVIAQEEAIQVEEAAEQEQLDKLD
jgi:hypothetical protein